MKNLMDIVEAVSFNGAEIQASDHPCFYRRRSRRAAMSLSDDTADDSSGDDFADDSSADDSSADDADIFGDDYDDD